MSETFPEPEHPDFEALRQMFNGGLDEAAKTPGFDLEAYVAQYVDPKSLSFMALQRAMHAFQIDDPRLLAEQMDSLMRVCALYLEAFTMGVQWRDRS